MAPFWSFRGFGVPSRKGIVRAPLKVPVASSFTGLLGVVSLSLELSRGSGFLLKGSSWVAIRMFWAVILHFLGFGVGLGLGLYTAGQRGMFLCLCNVGMCHRNDGIEAAIASS